MTATRAVAPPPRSVPFRKSIRAKLLLLSALLLLVPVIGLRFVQQMDTYLRNGQQQVLANSAKLLAATLSNRPQLFASGLPPASSEADELERRQVLAIFSGADPVAAAGLGNAYVPSDEVERILSVAASDSARIWVVDSRSRVRGLAGNVKPYVLDGGTAPSGPSSLYSWAVRPLVNMLAREGGASPDEVAADTQRLVMAQVDRALVGEPNMRTRPLGPGGMPVVSVAQPVWLGDNIVAAVVVEEAASSAQSLKVSALESLLAMTLIVLLVGFLSLGGFAWWLTARVRRLQSEAEHAIDANGRIVGTISHPDQPDEIGALAQTLKATVERLRRYNNYLEQMAARLAHELRTPVAVVRSSLDNLRAGSLPEDGRVYVARADQGVARLSNLIARMSEAAQLEGMLAGSDREPVDLVKLVAGCVDGYRQAFPERKFVFQAGESTSVPTRVVPDAIAQMIDKLVQNANDFGIAGTSIDISLQAYASHVTLGVENKGPIIATDRMPQLFLSMVSSRDQNAEQGHLGLGLYVSRIVAEHHMGRITAMNLPDGSGVRFEVTLPV